MAKTVIELLNNYENVELRPPDLAVALGDAIMITAS